MVMVMHRYVQVVLPEVRVRVRVRIRITARFEVKVKASVIITWMIRIPPAWNPISYAQDPKASVAATAASQDDTPIPTPTSDPNPNANLDPKSSILSLTTSTLIAVQEDALSDALAVATQLRAELARAQDLTPPYI